MTEALESSPPSSDSARSAALALFPSLVLTDPPTLPQDALARSLLQRHRFLQVKPGDDEYLLPTLPSTSSDPDRKRAIAARTRAVLRRIQQAVIDGQRASPEELILRPPRYAVYGTGPSERTLVALVVYEIELDEVEGLATDGGALDDRCPTAVELYFEWETLGQEESSLAALLVAPTGEPSSRQAPSWRLEGVLPPGFAPMRSWTTTLPDLAHDGKDLWQDTQYGARATPGVASSADGDYHADAQDFWEGYSDDEGDKTRVEAAAAASLREGADDAYWGQYEENGGQVNQSRSTQPRGSASDDSTQDTAINQAQNALSTLLPGLLAGFPSGNAALSGEAPPIDRSAGVTSILAGAWQLVRSSGDRRWQGEQGKAAFRAIAEQVLEEAP